MHETKNFPSSLSRIFFQQGYVSEEGSKDAKFISRRKILNLSVSSCFYDTKDCEVCQVLQTGLTL
jgi:hypothetical protein